jgi:hypothetical protein
MINLRASGVSVTVLGRWARMPDEPDVVLNWRQIDRLHESLCRRVAALKPKTKAPPA